MGTEAEHDEHTPFDLAHEYTVQGRHKDACQAYQARARSILSEAGDRQLTGDEREEIAAAYGRAAESAQIFALELIQGRVEDDHAPSHYRRLSEELIGQETRFLDRQTDEWPVVTGDEDW